MPETKPYVGDVGTLIEVEVGTDLSAASVRRIDVTKPDGVTSQWAATVKSGDNSVLQYTIVSGDFNVAGIWYGQVYVEWDASNKWYGQTFSFELFALGA